MCMYVCIYIYIYIYICINLDRHVVAVRRGGEHLEEEPGQTRLRRQVSPLPVVKWLSLLDFCVSYLRWGQCDIFCIVLSLTDDPRRESNQSPYCHVSDVVLDPDHTSI